MGIENERATGIKYTFFPAQDEEVEECNEVQSQCTNHKWPYHIFSEWGNLRANIHLDQMK